MDDYMKPPYLEIQFFTSSEAYGINNKMVHSIVNK